MSPTTQQLQRSLEEEKTTLADNLELLANKARALTDWREQVRAHPLAAIGAAAFAGLVLARLLERRPAARVRLPGDRIADADRPAAGHPAVDRIINALVGVAMTKAIEYVAEVVPGFTDHLVHDDPTAFSLDDPPRQDGMRP